MRICFISYFNVIINNFHVNNRKFVRYFRGSTLAYSEFSKSSVRVSSMRTGNIFTTLYFYFACKIFQTHLRSNYGRKQDIYVRSLLSGSCYTFMLLLVAKTNRWLSTKGLTS